jgi:hypothetical protein
MANEWREERKRSFTSKGKYSVDRNMTYMPEPWASLLSTVLYIGVRVHKLKE